MLELVVFIQMEVSFKLQIFGDQSFLWEPMTYLDRVWLKPLTLQVNYLHLNKSSPQKLCIT